MRNVRNILSMLSALFLVSCTPSVLPVNALQSEIVTKPKWVSQKPVSSLYYTGVGYSQKNSNDNYIQTAKSTALDDLTSEIKVEISSVSVLNQLDDSEGFSEEFESIIKTTISDEIQDYELVDSWEGENQYWIYYRLSKAEYKKQKADKRNNAMSLAKDDYVKGKQRMAAGDITSGIALYINGIYAIAPYLGQSNEILLGGDSILLGNALYNELQIAFNNLEISTDNNEYSINRRLDKDETVDVFVRTKSKNKEVGALPLKAIFSVGGGDVHPEYITNDNGKATVLISSIKSIEAKQAITISPNLEKLANLDESKKKYGMLLKGLQLPQKEIYFQINKPIVFIESKENKLGEATSSTQITDKVKQVLSAQGFALGRIKDKADLWIELLANTEKGKSSGSIYVTYFSLNINVIDINTGTEIHHAGIDRLKAFSLNYDRSSQSGYEKALEVLEKETLPQLIEEILQ